MKRVVMGATQLWKQKGHRVGLHSIGDHFLANGCHVSWVTEPASLLYFTKPTRLRWKLRRIRQGLAADRVHIAGSGTLVNHTALGPFHPSASVPFLGSYSVAANYWKVAFRGLLSRPESGLDSADLLIFDIGGIGCYPAFAPRAKLTVHRVSDLVCEVPWASRGMVELERLVLREADVVLAASEVMLGRVIAIRGRSEGVYLLPNGVDVEMFLRPYPEPQDYLPLPRPRAVYLGSLAPWIDWDLLRAVAESRQDISFCVVGGGPHPSGLPRNVHMLGPKDYTEVPAYLQHADVGLIVFKDWERIRSVEKPLKFYQYIASGLPVVSVSYGSLSKMGPTALLADTPDEFSRALDTALSYSDEDKQRLRDEAKTHSWESRFALLDSILAAHGFDLRASEPVQLAGPAYAD